MKENLRLEWRTPAELAENPRNWRTHPQEQLAALTDVMSEVGWAGALLYNERTGRIIDGHARRKVALEQGSEKVPVLVGDWSEEDEAKILVTLDPLAALATADAAKLDAVLREVQTENEELARMMTDLALQNGVIPEVDRSGNDVGDAYQGMPEFEQEDLLPKYSVKVNFLSLADLQDFAQRIGQPLTEHTRSVWHPRQEPLAWSNCLVTEAENES